MIDLTNASATYLRFTVPASLPDTTVLGPVFDGQAPNAAASKARRLRNLADGRCLNDTANPTHGPREFGQLCRRCAAVKRVGAVLVAEIGVDEALSREVPR